MMTIWMLHDEKIDWKQILEDTSDVSYDVKEVI